MIQFKSHFSLATWLSLPYTNSYPPYLKNVLSSTSSVHFPCSIFTLHLWNDGLPFASSVVMSQGKGCEVLDAGVGGFIVLWPWYQFITASLGGVCGVSQVINWHGTNLLLLLWAVCVVFFVSIHVEHDN
jgi:hypothetical protein